MKSKLAVSAQTLAVCVLLGAIPAKGTTIDIGLAEGSGSIETVATGTGSSGASWAGSYDNYIFNVILASDPVPIDLGSGTLDVTLPAALGGSTAPIYVYVTETGLTSPPSTLDFQSILSASLPAGWSETETTYEDSADAAYGTATELASMNGSGTQNTTTEAAVGSTFSLTEVYEIFSDGLAGIDVSTENIKAAPAPSIGSGIPGMLAVGGILLGWKLLERRRQS